MIIYCARVYFVTKSDRAEEHIYDCSDDTASKYDCNRADLPFPHHKQTYAEQYKFNPVNVVYANGSTSEKSEKQN